MTKSTAKQPSSSGLTLLIDDREKYVAPFFNSVELQQGMGYKVLRLVIGDFAIIDQGGNIIALFERKTYSDYAASIKDGRHKNKQNLLTERSKNNCDVYYIIEGGLDYLMRNSTVEGLPASTIQSSITNLMTRDKIFVLNTINPRHTAQRLLDVLKSYKKQHNNIVCAPVVGACESNNVAVNDDQESNITSDSIISNTPASITNTDIPAVLVSKEPKTIQEIKKEMILSIPFITNSNYNLFSSFSIEELCGRHIVDGNPMVQPRIQRNLYVTDELLNKMLLKIPLVSKRIAGELVKAHRNDILAGTLNSNINNITGLSGALIKKINAIVLFKPQEGANILS